MIRLKKHLFLSITILLFGNLYGQDWITEYKPSSSFIENKGQFRSNNAEKIGGIDFAVDYGSTRIFFGKKGVSYDFLEAEKKSREERKEIMAQAAFSVEEHKEKERLFGKFMYKFDDVYFNWKNGSSKTKIVGIKPNTDYHSYSYEDNKGEIVSVGNVKGFQKIRYKNIYPGIDIEYTIHPISGVKYALYLAPNADPNQVEMQYNKDISIKEGIIHIPTVFGDILDHAPITFYESNNEHIIDSKYSLKGNTVKFKLGNYDKSKDIIIDPWVQTPTFNTDWNCIWECEYDAAGNIYTIGGTMPLKLQKYDPTGNLLWTHNTPYDTTSWLGGFATSDAGVSYITQGSVNSIQKVDNAGNVVWTNNTGGGSIGSSHEYWNVQFNCDESKVIVGGTHGAFGLPPVLQAAIFEIDVNNGNQLSSQILATGNSMGFPPTIQEVRALSASPSSKYYWLAHDTIGFINDNFDMCTNTAASTFKIDNGMNLGYKAENYRYNNTGIMAIRADENFLYVNKGDQIQKRDLQTLAILATANIPGGGLINVTLGGNQVENSGIDIDDCGNIYVGSINQVIQFDNNLNQINTFPTSFRVYDVHVAPNGKVIAAGSTGTESSNARDGYIQQFDVGSCAPLQIICCDANFCYEGPFCLADAPITIEVSQAGGTFSGPGVNPSTGVFDPSIAGVGTHTITYTLPCGEESLNFVVEPCAVLEVCEETNGDFTASGGVGPYDWEVESTTTSPINNQTECEDCGYSWMGIGPLGQCMDGMSSVSSCTSTGWSNYDNGTTTNAPSNYPIRVTDSQGSSVVINSAAEVNACTNTPCTNLTVTVSNQENVTCNGLDNGSATISATDGNGSYTYTWSPGALNGATQNNLAPNTYTVNVIDTDGCSGSVTVEITEPSAIDVQMSATNATCGASDGSATATVSGGTTGYTYSWSNGATTSTINNVAAGSYSVSITDGNNCPATGSIVVTTASGPTLSINNQTDVSCFGGDNGTAEVSASGGTPGYTYTWTPGGLTGSTQNNLSAGTYTVQVEDADGCTATTSVIIDQPTEISLSTSFTSSSCTVADGSATVVATGGSGNYTYSWSPGGETTSSINGITAGAYTVTVTDDSGCDVQVTLNLPSLNGPQITIDNTTDVSCFGEADGSAQVSVTGGTPGYTYNWSPSGGSASTANGLSSGSYTLTVEDGAGCISTETVVINEPEEIIITGTTVNAQCASTDGSITTTTAGGDGSYTYNWSPNGESTPSLNNVSAGTYDVTVTDGSGCSTSNSFIIEQNDSIDVFIVPDNTTIQAGDEVVFNVTTNPTVTNPNYTWTPSDGLSCTNCQNPTASPNSTTTYTVVVTSDEGCVGAASAVININEPCKDPFVPTIFSPNNDGKNDFLCLYGSCFQSVTLAIYNRWGEKVFETNSPDDCWDGTYKDKKVNSGTFVYKLKYNLYNEAEKAESGNITVVR